MKIDAVSRAGAIAGAIFLLLQVLLVLECQTQKARNFCWAPHTTQISYTVEVEVGGRILSGAEARRRYRLRTAWEVHALQNLKDLIAQYEETYGRGDGARVRIEYRVNGKERVEWRWPG